MGFSASEEKLFVYNYRLSRSKSASDDPVPKTDRAKSPV